MEVFVTIEQHQITEAKRMRSLEIPVPWEVIAKTLGVPAFKLRCAMETGFREYRIEAVKRYRARVRRQKCSTREDPCAENNYRIKHPSFNIVTPDERVTIPEQVLFDRERRRELSHPSFTAAWQGDPLPGYSALDRRRGA